MSANIKVTLSSVKLEVAAGEPVEATVSVRNQSQIVDQFTVKVEGLDSTWWTLSASSVSLFPGDQEEVKLTIHPPKEAEARAGSYPFQVKAVSQTNPQEATVAEAYLALRGFSAWEAKMTPTKIIGQSGVYRIIIDNGGNADTNLVFEGEDAEENLYYKFDHDELTVPAGESVRVNMTVRPKKGEAKKQYNFKVTVKPADGKLRSREVKVLNGQLEYFRRKFPWWILLLILGLGIAAFAAWKVLLPPPQTISITSPKAGESWLVGSTQNITWTPGTGIARVFFECSIDGGKSWNHIIGGENAPDSGTFLWKVPDTPSNNCVVRATAYGAKDEILARGTSKAFTIFKFPIIPFTPIPLTPWEIK